jgi:peptidoglycan hydrolase-like protein with peptidoglycan-binding domain
MDRHLADRRRLAALDGAARARTGRNADRPDRMALWAVFLALLAGLAAAATAKGQDGGTPAPGGPGEPVNVQLGERTLREGMQGTDVRVLQELLRAKRLGSLPISGLYDAQTRDAVQRFEQMAGLEPDGGVFGAETKSALVGRMRARQATWYGPGFYGKRTACGGTLTPDTLGVAHKTLPCGTEVTFYYEGRFLTVKVIDRGPFSDSYSWDLTRAAARELGFKRTDYVRSAHHRPARSSRARRR